MSQPVALLLVDEMDGWSLIRGLAVLRLGGVHRPPHLAYTREQSPLRAISRFSDLWAGGTIARWFLAKAARPPSRRSSYAAVVLQQPPRPATPSPTAPPANGQKVFLAFCPWLNPTWNFS